MKTQAEILAAIEHDGWKHGAIDGRDLSRLADFFPVSEWHFFGMTLKEGADAPDPKAWTEQNIIARLKGDVAFGFIKALDQRGISASCMNAVVKMWLWVLDDPLADHDDYPQYGLPLLKLVADQHGFPNPIGGDIGNEAKYAQEEW